MAVNVLKSKVLASYLPLHVMHESYSEVRSSCLMLMQRWGSSAATPGWPHVFGLAFALLPW